MRRKEKEKTAVHEQKRKASCALPAKHENEKIEIKYRMLDIFGRISQKQNDVFFFFMIMFGWFSFTPMRGEGYGHTTTAMHDVEYTPVHNYGHG